MRDFWLVADTHFGHKNMLNFLRADGTPVRPGFASVEEMDEIMIQNWNAVVKPHDYVYHLGDVTFDYKKFEKDIGPRLIGHKRLILGNHDKIKGTNLLNFFEKLELWKGFDALGIVATHIPIAACHFRGKCTRNIHGHIHHRSTNSPIHACLSVEWTNYSPVNLDEVDKYFGLNGEPCAIGDSER